MSTGIDDSKYIKKPNVLDTFTLEDIEHLKNCMHPIDGPMYFMENFMIIQHPTRGSLPFVPYGYQRELVASYHKYRQQISLLGRQLGKALCLETDILTPSGFVKMGDLEVGDTIYGRDGKPTQITFITDTMYNHDCYDVTFDTGETIRADAEHIWVANYKGKEREFTTVELLEKLDMMQQWQKPARPSIDGHSVIEFEEQKTHIDPYLLGLWIGDGNRSQGRVTCHRDDFPDYMERLENLKYSISRFKEDRRTENTGYFHLSGLLTDLKENGLYQNKHIPEEYIFNSVENRLELLRGLMDSDGYAMDCGTCQFYQSNEVIADSVKLLLNTLGIKCSKTVKKTTHKDCYMITFCSEDFVVFNLERKTVIQEGKTHGHPKNKRFYVASIEKAKSVPVRCLQVDNDEHLFLCGRDLIPTHNTTCAAGYLLWYAMFIPDSYILVASKTGADALDIMDRIRYAYEGLPDFIRAGVREYNKKTMKFDNNSIIVSTTTTNNTGRGKSISLIYLDEFAFVDPPSVAKELWTSLSPTLSTGGKVILTSTPNSDQDQFAEIWFDSQDMHDEYGNGYADGVGKNGFGSYFATYKDHPDRDEEWARGEEAKIGNERFRREHLAEFIVFEETLISSVKLASMKGKEPFRKSGQVRWFRQINKNKTYAVSLDPCMGTGGDNAAITVWEVPSMKQVAEWKHNKTSIEGQMKVLRDILLEIWEHDKPEIYWSLESNTLGEAALVIIRDTGEENFPGTFLSEKRSDGGSRKRKGFTTTPKNKRVSCSRLKQWVESGQLSIYSQPLITELKNFIARGNSYQAKDGTKDDLVSSLLIFVRMVEYIATWDDETSDAINSNIDDEWEESSSAPLPILI